MAEVRSSASAKTEASSGRRCDEVRGPGRIEDKTDGHARGAWNVASNGPLGGGVQTGVQRTAGRRECEVDRDVVAISGDTVHESQIDQVLAELRIDHLAQRLADGVLGHE